MELKVSSPVWDTDYFERKRTAKLRKESEHQEKKKQIKMEKSKKRAHQKNKKTARNQNQQQKITPKEQTPGQPHLFNILAHFKKRHDSNSVTKQKDKDIDE